ncbi:NnrU family protein [Marinobacter bohaiensis]|uniref:NnrU family protein n=1 Tax=Marinobacter bohaiensis TaxID=2201898 RepID=UPI000DAB78C5|nr:NnrU family protein [Marinobacter bohaiensis]
MGVLILGLVLFLGVHSLSIVASGGRDRLVARLGEQPFKGLYSLASLVGLILIIWGYGLARQEPVVVYLPPAWLRHLALLLLLPVFPLLLATYLPGRIQRAAKHPTLIAVKLWALAHLLANGMLADVVLFGAFLAWAVAERISLKRRTPRAVPALPASPRNDLIAVVGGLLVYGAFVVWLHRVLIGVPPVAM